MDAPPLSPERSRELADLRRRAYGPGADIARDPVAQQRLSELEELARTVPDEPMADQVDPYIEDAVPDGDEASAAVDEPAANAGSAPEGASARPLVDSAEPPSARSRRWWRRVPLWSITAVAGIAIGVAIGFTWPSDDGPPPDLTLGIDPSGGERGAGFAENLDYWGVDEGTVVPHEAYDVIQVWTALGVDGSRCLLLSHEGSFLSATCTGSGLDPVLDFTIYDGMSLDLQDALPVGTVIRFAGHEGSVDVWVRPPGGQDPSASSEADSAARPA